LLCAPIKFKTGKLIMLVKDLPTEAARSVGMLDGAAALRFGRATEQLAYKVADHIVVISNAFAGYIQRLGVSPSRITEIPDWADVETIRPAAADIEMRRRLGAGPEDFLVVHAGNMGGKQDLLNVVSAARLLKQDERIRLALVGDGTERIKIAEKVAAQHLDNIRLLPLQASQDFPKVLTAGDLLLVNQAPMVVDSVLPSKLLAYMSSGRPVIAAVHPKSTTAELVRRSGCGLVTDANNPEALATSIRWMAGEASRNGALTSMGERGRAYVERNFDRKAILARWDALLAQLVGTDG
jgi:glycosyltransferase involved in cell wall biosynthesis